MSRRVLSAVLSLVLLASWGVAPLASLSFDGSGGACGRLCPCCERRAASGSVGHPCGGAEPSAHVSCPLPSLHLALVVPPFVHPWASGADVRLADGDGPPQADAARRAGFHRIFAPPPRTLPS